MSNYEFCKEALIILIVLVVLAALSCWATFTPMVGVITFAVIFGIGVFAPVINEPAKGVDRE